MMIKDLEIALQVARDLKIPAIMNSLAMQLYRAAGSAGFSDKELVLWLISLVPSGE